MIDPITTFFLLGAIIFIGFLGLRLFERTRIPDILILIALGTLIGPIFHVIDPKPLFAVVPIFAPLAMIILLFEGGMSFNIRRVLAELPKASIFTFFTFTLATVFVAVALCLAFKWDFLVSLLLGSIVGGTSSAIVIPLLKRVRGEPETECILSLESALTDALCIVVAITIAQLIARPEAVTVNEALKSLAGAFSVAAVFGLIVGVAWIHVLCKLKGQPFSYLLTLATVFVMYSAAEASGGNGGIAALVFGVALGNAYAISKVFRMEQAELSAEVKHFQTEVGFFVRTFFFVYIGVLFDPKIFSFELVLIGLVVLAAIILARLFAVRVLAGRRAKPSNRFLLAAMLPRGLAAAVLSTMPAGMGVKAPFLTEVVLLTIILTNIATTFGLFFFEKKFGFAKPEVEATAKAVRIARAERPKIIKVK